MIFVSVKAMAVSPKTNGEGDRLVDALRGKCICRLREPNSAFGSLPILSPIHSVALFTRIIAL